MVAIATFYRFVHLDNYQDMQSHIKIFCVEREIKGTILLAEEGINGTVSGSDENAISDFFAFMNTETRLSDLTFKMSYADDHPFERMKVRLKLEIVALGINNLNMEQRGEYILPEDWDGFILQDDVLLIDTRNTYEINLGTFKGSMSPDTYNFRDFPSWAQELQINKKKKIAMYCTGGVRCEKSTAYMKQLGFENVYHLKGGILNYLEKTKNKIKAWDGNCFVFDDRVAVDDSLQPSKDIKCIVCGDQASKEDLKSISRGKVFCVSCA